MLIYLLLGLITTVLSTWAMATALRTSTYTQQRRYSNQVINSEKTPNEVFLTVHRWWSGATLHTYLSIPGNARPRSASTPAPSLNPMIPRWARRPLLPWQFNLPGWATPADRAAPTGPSLTRMVYAYGWPARALWCERKFPPRSPTYTKSVYTIEGAWAIPASATTPDATPRAVLPYRPIWTGLALNTLFYSAALALPWLAVSSLRRRRRIRAGRCSACNYDLRGLTTGPCPECGHIPDLRHPA